MNEKTPRSALQFFVSFLGVVALLAGLSTVLLGASSIIGAKEVSGTVDSEMRFYAVWYAAAGGVLLRSAVRVEAEGRTIRATALLFFVAGCSRALSWWTVGEPDTAAQVLMVIELILPLIIIPWQAAVARSHSRGLVEDEG